MITVVLAPSVFSGAAFNFNFVGPSSGRAAGLFRFNVFQRIYEILGGEREREKERGEGSFLTMMYN